MEKKTKAGPKVAETVTKIVALLEPLESDDRQRAIKASLTILGEVATNGARSAVTLESGDDGKDAQDLSSDSAKAKTWIKQTALTMAQVERVSTLEQTA